MKHVSIRRYKLSKKLLTLANLSEAYALHLNKLWWCTEQTYEKCLIDASVHTLSLQAEDIYSEAAILLGRAQEKSRQVATTTVSQEVLESKKELLEKLYSYSSLVAASYQDLLREPYSPLTLELLKRCAFETQNLSYILLVLFERMRFLESENTVSQALHVSLKNAINYPKVLN